MSGTGDDSGLGEELNRLFDSLRADLEATHRARERGLTACRRTIQACGQAIRSVHRLQPDRAAQLTSDAEGALRDAQRALDPFPNVKYAGFLHDAEKEYVEAVLTVALIDGTRPLPDRDALGVMTPAWMCGLAEAASELRRHLLDRLREGRLEQAEQLLRAMEDVYDLLVTIDYPDALTGGLRRTTDGLRAVLERSRGDLTNSIVQARLRQALETRDQSEG